MARHSSFKIVIAHEAYNNFFATIRARAQAQQWVEFGLDGDRLGDEGAESAFISVDGLPGGKSESWIESWLAGKTNGPTV
jgi:hypothetical protein